MLTNDTIITNNCDNNITDTNSNPTTNVVVNMCISGEYSKSTGSSPITMAAEATNADREFQINKTASSGTQLQKAKNLTCQSALMSWCSDEEAMDDEDSETEEIFYDSTNESEDYEREQTNEDIRCEGKTRVECAEDCSLSELCLNEVEIDSKEEQETITELVDVAKKDTLLKVKENKSLRVTFGVILRLIFPLANGVVRGIRGMRDVRFLKAIRSIASSRQALTNLFAFAANTISLNLSSVQVSHRIEPILNLLKIRKHISGIESLPDSPILEKSPEAFTVTSCFNSTAPLFSPLYKVPRYSLPNFQGSTKQLAIEEYVATNFCTLNILAEPPPGEPIRADIVLIHGLHGSLVNTWKQGLWENERRPVEFQRPPKPPVRPPKRPRHSRTSTVHPPHHKKRARFTNIDVYQRHSHERDFIDDAEENGYSFICGEPKDVQKCDGIEYSFPTFRLRIHDNGCLLQAEQDSKHLGFDINQNTTAERAENGDNFSERTKERNDAAKSSKPSANDPNYSKCWPGDWLPIDCPGVRVVALNYTTDQHLWRPLWKKKEPRSNLIQRSREMTELLIKHRVGYGHPIIWVGHSKGGLFIKQIIVDAWEGGRPAAAPFWRSARGVFFYSVPHRGSHLASIKAPFLVRSVELIDIEKNSKYLLDLHRRFVGLYHLGHLKIEVFSFVETALTLMSVLYLRIVGADSADPGIGDVCGIRLDHREICKPRSRDCILYKKLVNMINKVC